MPRRIFRKKFITLILFSIVFFSLLDKVSADNGFSFITDPQSIGLNEKSKELKIHSDIPVTETTYFTLVSTSNTGQFFSNSTTIEPVASGSYLYISSNSSNRSVYYKDTTAGDFIITVNIFNKEKTNQIATISQHILVGQTSNEIISTTTPTQTDNINTYSNLSSHTSVVEISGYKPKETFVVSIGRDRLATTNETIQFEAKSNNPNGGVEYHWSFGDGMTAYGRKVEHQYEFQGDYVVVLNSNYLDESAVSRINIKVIEPSVSIIEAGLDYIKIRNNSKYEVNLYGWKLIYQNKSFDFPLDTIVLAGKDLILASKITDFKPLNKSEIILSMGDSKDTGVINKQNISSTNSLNDIYTKAVSIKQQLSKLNQPEATASLPNKNTANVYTSLNLGTTSTSTPNKDNWFEKLKRFLFKRN